MRPTYIELNSQALLHNLKRIREFSPRARITAMVKANAYGHGADWVASLIENKIESFGVCNIDEALALHEVVPDATIVIMHGVRNLEELKIAHQHRFVLVIHQIEQLELLSSFALTHHQDIYLKINTGMNRLGFRPDQFDIIFERINAMSSIKKPITVMTHFGEADAMFGKTTANQIDQFLKLTKGHDVKKSLANSAGVIHWPDSHLDNIRPGIMMYGISPSSGVPGKDYQLKAVMSLHSEIMALNICEAGEKIGYGGQYVCPEKMLVGVIPIGYGDGYPRHLPSGSPVLVNNMRVKLVGRVSMDLITVDLRNQPFCKVGDPVLLWGKNLPIEEIAECAETIPYELTCQLTARVPRRTV